MTSCVTLSRSASSIASYLLCSDEKWEGRSTARTFSLPNARAAKPALPPNRFHRITENGRLQFHLPEIITDTHDQSIMDQFYLT